MAESRGGRPVSGSQRPTGGDKAIVSNKRQFFRRRKVCKFCVEKIDLVDYKDARMLSQFISERGKIVPRRLSGVCTPCQRRLAEAVKQARSIALLPFATGIPRG
jgi:small subunit ribosomal protein S18